MKELKELVEKAERADSLCLLMQNVNPHHILAIDDEIKALKQRAEAAESLAAEAAIKCGAYAAANLENLNRAEAAEAKLAELEKQEPVLFRDSQGCFVSKGKGEQLIKSGEFVTPYYLRPVPAINLADLVPGVIENYESITNVDWMTPRTAAQTYWNACRDAILRNIEERSK